MSKLFQNKWINPMFWDHPTPVNLLILIFGFIVFFTAVAFVGVWFFHFVGTYLPWPPRP